MEELNEKLATWAGFTFSDDWSAHNPYKTPDGTIIHNWVPFTESLDACFKWLVPKLQDAGYMVDLIAYEYKGFYAKLSSIFQSARGPEGYYEPIADANDEIPALALCKAIEHLIDAKTEAI